MRPVNGVYVRLSDLCAVDRQAVRVTTALQAAVCPARVAHKKGPRDMIQDLRLASMSVVEAKSVDGERKA